MPKTATSQSATSRRPSGTARAKVQTEPEPFRPAVRTGPHPDSTLRSGKEERSHDGVLEDVAGRS
jgi:hypothetical protein